MPSLPMNFRFVGRPIDRGATLALRRDPDAVRALREGPQARFLLVHSKRVLVTPAKALAWKTRADMLALAPDVEPETIYLGPLVDGAPIASCEAFAVDLGPFVQDMEAPPGLMWQSGRDFMLSSASDADVSVAGLALALAGWHETARFEGSSGKPAESVEGGAKRQEVGGTRKIYPRTDPVAIGIISSPDGEKILLGRQTRYPKGMYTCLSGFVDQCESVEKAFRREAFEEAGVNLASIELLATQPWPIGRAGSCELMIGCRGVATTEDFMVNRDELEDARWFARQEVLAMLDGSHPDGLAAPGKYAIAHHLISSWARPSAELHTAALETGLRSHLLLGLLGLLAGFLLAAPWRGGARR